MNSNVRGYRWSPTSFKEVRVVTGCADGSMAAEIVSADTHLKAVAVEEQGIALVMSRTQAGELLRAMRVLGSEFADGRCLSGDPRTRPQTPKWWRPSLSFNRLWRL